MGRGILIITMFKIRYLFKWLESPRLSILYLLGHPNETLITLGEYIHLITRKLFKYAVLHIK